SFSTEFTRFQQLAHVRFSPENEQVTALPRNDVMCHVWTAPSWQGETARRLAGRCGHVFGLFVRRRQPLWTAAPTKTLAKVVARRRGYWHNGLRPERRW